MMGLKKEYEIAAKSQANIYYPAFIIDRTNEARVSELQLYTDIFSKCKKVVYNQMISYVINAEDFNKYFTIVETNLAVRNETQKPSSKITDESDTSETESTKTSQDKVSNTGESPKQISPDRNGSRIGRGADIKQIKRQVRLALYRRRKRAQLQRKNW